MQNIPYRFFRSYAIKICIFFIVVLFFHPRSVFAETIKLQIPLPGMSEITVCDGGSCSGIATYISTIAQWIVGALTLLAVLFIMIGGIVWLTSRANPKQAEFAKKLITDSLLGLILALGSYMLLATISPTLVSFSSLSIQPIDKIEFEAGPFANPLSAEIENIMTNTPKSVVDRINLNMTLYKKIGAEKGVPWMLIAAIHFQESANKPTISMLNGGKYCNNNDRSRCSACDNGETQENDMRCAVGLMKSKGSQTGGSKNYTDKKVFNLTFQTNDYTDPHGALANISFRYNGVCPHKSLADLKIKGTCLNVDKSAYVMNNFSSQHQNMPFAAVNSAADPTPIFKIWKIDGTLASIKRLNDPTNYAGGDINGKLLQLK